jgi:hypothetical protein
MNDGFQILRRTLVALNFIELLDAFDDVELHPFD